jgi:hypothetical protein
MQRRKLRLRFLLRLVRCVWVADGPVKFKSATNWQLRAMNRSVGVGQQTSWRATDNAIKMGRELNVRLQASLDVGDMVSIIVNSASSLCTENLGFLSSGRHVDFGSEVVGHG